MSDFLLDMEWHVCPDGYHVAPAPMESIYSDELVANSEAVRTYKPFQKYEMLYSAFAKLKTRDDVVRFIDRFGPIFKDTLDIAVHLRDAKAFRELLLAKQRSAKKVCSTFKQHMAQQQAASSKQFNEWLAASMKLGEERIEAEAARWTERFSAILNLKPGDLPASGPIEIPKPELHQVINADGPIIIEIGQVYVESDPEEGLRLKITPKTLMQGLWVQLARKLSSKTIIRTCRYCGSTFEAGAGSKRRADATFCSREHSIRFHSLNRSKGV
jgi:hypothetical protein